MNLWFCVMTMSDKSPLRLTRSHFGLQRRPVLLSVETHPSFLELLLWDLHSLQDDTAAELILGIRGFPHNFAVSSSNGNVDCSLPFLDVNTSFALSLRAWISDASYCPSSSISATITSPFQIPSPQPMHILGRFQVKLSYQLGGALTGLLQKSDDIQPWRQVESLNLEMVLPIVFHKVFSHLPGGIEYSRIAEALSRISPPFLIQTSL